MIECRNCDNKFIPAVHNQVYCSADCRVEYTNRQAMIRYHARKNRTKPERCKCGVKLSKYNEEEVCSGCQRKSISHLFSAIG